MKKILTTLILASTTMLSGPSFADNNKSMLGTWVGIGNTAIIGDSIMHHNAPKGPGVRFTNTEFTYKIDVVNGRNFSGTKLSKTNTEILAGALSADGVNGMIVDTDGISTIKRVGNDIFQECYAHVPNAKSNSSVVGCTEFKRQ
jgi:hypothetical protein